MTIFFRMPVFTIKPEQIHVLQKWVELDTAIFELTPANSLAGANVALVRGAAGCGRRSRRGSGRGCGGGRRVGLGSAGFRGSGGAGLSGRGRGFVGRCGGLRCTGSTGFGRSAGVGGISFSRSASLGSRSFGRGDRVSRFGSSRRLSGRTGLR